MEKYSNVQQMTTTHGIVKMIIRQWNDKLKWNKNTEKNTDEITYTQNAESKCSAENKSQVK